MTVHVTSADGTRIAFDRLGEGPPLIVVGGILCDRQTTRALAEQLATHLSVTNHDRRGRGESGDTALYAVEREIEDLGALIDEAGGTAAVYGHSSGASLALEAAAGGLPIPKLVLHEPPYGPDDEESRESSGELAEQVAAALAEDRRGGTIPEERVRALTMPTLVISGSESPAFFQDTAARITELLPNGEHAVLESQDHGASADAVAPVVAEFVA